MWVIGDVHGEYKMLMNLIDKLPYDKDKVCFVGDLIDRGEDSAKVVKFIRDHNYLCVLGNHEKMAIEAYNDKSYFETWKDGIGKEMIASYKRENRDILYDIEWFKTLPLFLEFSNIKNSDFLHLLVTHAFSLSHYPFDLQDENTLRNILWSRKVPKFHSELYNKGVFNVFGHTSLDDKIVFDKEWACVDVGASKGGKLAALHFPKMSVVYCD